MEAANARIAKLEQQVVELEEELVQLEEGYTDLVHQEKGGRLMHEAEIQTLTLQKRAYRVRGILHAEELTAEIKRLNDHNSIVANLVSALTTTDKSIHPELISALAAVVRTHKAAPVRKQGDIKFEEVVKKMTEICEEDGRETYFEMDEGDAPSRSAYYECHAKFADGEADWWIPADAKVLWTITDEAFPQLDRETGEYA